MGWGGSLDQVSDLRAQNVGQVGKLRMVGHTSQLGGQVGLD